MNDQELTNNYQSKLGDVRIRVGPAKNHVKKGYAYLKKKDWDKAISEFDKAIEIYSKNLGIWDAVTLDWDAYNGKGLAYEGKNELDFAINSYREIQIPDSDDIFDRTELKYLENKANAYFKKDRWNDAIMNYSAVIEWGYPTSKTYTQDGCAYIQSAKWNLDIGDRMQAFYAEDKLNFAIIDFTKAIDLDKDNVSAYNNRGFAYYKLSQLDKAIADYDKTVSLDRKSEVARYERAYVLSKLGSKDKAISDLKTCIKTSNDKNLIEKANNLLAKLR